MNYNRSEQDQCGVEKLLEAVPNTKAIGRTRQAEGTVGLFISGTIAKAEEKQEILYRQIWS